MARWIAALLLGLSAATTGAQGYKPSGIASVETVYVFGVHPHLNPQDLFEAYEPIMRYLERKLPGTRFRLEGSRDYAEFEAKVRAQKLHFALPNPAQTVAAIDAGYRVIAKGMPDEDFRGLLVARKAGAPGAPAELAGQALCFPSATAVAATMLPLLDLHDRGIAVATLKISYVGSQFSAILNAHSGEYAACGTSARFWRVWTQDHPDKAKDMTVLWRTPTLPHNGVVARADVPPGLAGQVAAALAGMAKDSEIDQGQFRLGQQHFEIADNARYAPMREFLRRYDKAIGLPAAFRQ